MNKINKKLLLILICLITANSHVLASEFISITTKYIDPETSNQSWFKFTEPAGAQITDTVVLRNNSSQPQKVKLYPLDAYANDSGSFTLKNSIDPQVGIGAWTKLEQNSLTLSPNQEQMVDFAVNIPQTASPGQYIGGIVVEQDQKNECENNPIEKCSGNILVKTRTGNRIYLNIPGQRIEKIELKKTTISHHNSETQFHFIIDNQGNTSFAPKANLEIYNFWGQKIDSGEFSLGHSYPNSTITPSISWQRNSFIGPFTAKVRVSFLELDQGRINTLRGAAFYQNLEYEFWIIPWATILFFLFLILALVTYFYYRHLVFQKILNTCTSYEVKKGETIDMIAEKCGVNWSTLAKINKLQAPFALKEQQKILAPKKINVQKKK